MLDLGDVKVLSINITDANGAAANATSVSLTITLPDNSTVVQTNMAPTVVGQYDYAYATTQSGRHVFRWVATGTNANAHTDIFEVRPAYDSTFISLSDVKAFLNIDQTKTQWDEELRDCIYGACDVVEFLVGNVGTRTYTEYLDGSPDPAAFGNYNGVYQPMDTHQRASTEVQVSHRPIISVTSVVEVFGNVSNALTEVQIPDATSNASGFSVDKETGVITRKAGGWPGAFPYGLRNVVVTYVAGRLNTPGNIMFGTKELIGHLWRQSQLNSEGRRPRVARPEPITVIMGYAVPNRVLEMLQATPRIPTIG